VKITQKFRKNVELEVLVFQQTVGHPYLVQLVSIFQTKAFSEMFT